VGFTVFDEYDVMARPQYKPTADARNSVEVWTALGHRQRTIAIRLGLSEKSLRKYFRDELDHGAESVQAAMNAVRSKRRNREP